MVVMLRTVSTLGRLTTCSSGATSRVWCGFSKPNASFNDRETSWSCKSKNTTGFKFSQVSSDFPSRCQADVAVYPLPTRKAVGVLELSIQMGHLLSPAVPETIEQYAAPLPRSFLVESVNGILVECSARGSRPLYSNVLAEFQRSSFSQREREDLANADDHNVVKKAFLTALANGPGDAHLLSVFAMFTWKLLGDWDTAEELYTKALELGSHDPDIHASYALFLWHCDS